MTQPTGVQGRLDGLRPNSTMMSSSVAAKKVIYTHLLVYVTRCVVYPQCNKVISISDTIVDVVGRNAIL